MVHDERGGASVHVVTTPLRHPWRAATSAVRLSRWLRAEETAGFFVGGRTSAGRGRRDISRTLSPNRLAVVVEWRSPDAAEAGRAGFDAVARAGGAQVWSARLVPLRARGTWDGATPFRPAPAPKPEPGGAVASLTCARIRPSRLGSFYLRSFPGLAREARRRDSAMVAGLGFGGPVPLRDAFTISFWPSDADVDAFAFRKSAHDLVRQRSTQQEWLRQSLFARFAIADHGGTWAGGDPLSS